MEKDERAAAPLVSYRLFRIITEEKVIGVQPKRLLLGFFTLLSKLTAFLSASKLEVIP